MPGQMPRVDVLFVSLGGTAGLREADAELAASLRRRARRSRSRAWRGRGSCGRSPRSSSRGRSTRAARRHERVGALAPRAVIYSTTTAALLGPVPGAIRFDAPAAGNRPGRHGIWQRPVEARRFKDGAAARAVERGRAGRGAGAARRRGRRADAGRAVGRRRSARHRRDHLRRQPGEEGPGPRARGVGGSSRAPGEELVVAGLDERAGAAWLARATAAARETLAAAQDAVDARARGGARPARPARAARPAQAARRRASRRRRAMGGGTVRFTGLIARDRVPRAAAPRSRVFLSAPRREDYGIAQLEALADGCVLVTTPSPGPYAALPIARRARSTGSSARGSRSGPRSTCRCPTTPSAPRSRSSRSRRRRSTASWPSNCCRGLLGDGELRR